MTREIKQHLKWNVDTFVIKKFKVYDLLGSTDFVLSSGEWWLHRRSTGEVIDSGAVTINNSDTDTAGNAIKTIRFSVDLRRTDDYDLGSHYLVIKTQLTTGQTDFFRFSVELVDYRTKEVI